MIGLKIRSNVEKLKPVRNFIKKLLSVIKGPVLTYLLRYMMQKAQKENSLNRDRP